MLELRKLWPSIVLLRAFRTLASLCGNLALLTLGFAPAASAQLSLPTTIVDATQGSYYYEPLTPSRGNTPYHVSLVDGSTLPQGLQFLDTQSSPLLSGTPQVFGQFVFTIEVSDGSSPTIRQTRQYHMTIHEGGSHPFVFLATTLPDATYGAPYGPQIVVTGGIYPYYASYDGAGSLFVFDRNSSVVSGSVATSPGTHQLPVTFQDSSYPRQLIQTTLTITVKPGISLAPVLRTGTVFQPYSDRVFVTAGGVAPYQFTLTSGTLPPGLTLDRATGAFSGTPSIPGTFSFQIGVTDSTGLGGSQDYAIQINGLAIDMTPSGLPVGRMNVAYPVTAFSVQGGVAPYTLARVDGALPPGMSFSPDWVLSGTPTEPGYYFVDLRATDQIGDIGQFEYDIHIQGVGPSTLLDGYTGLFYGSALIPVEYSTACRLFLVSGSLPPGISLVTQLATSQFEPNRFYLTGAPTQAGAFTFTIRAQDPGGLPADRTYTLYVSRPRLSIFMSHFGSFSLGQLGATYTVTVGNIGGYATSDVVTMAAVVPSGLTLVSLSGTGWNCSGVSCTRSDALNRGASYPPITVTVNVAANATSPQVNSVDVSGGGSAGANATDSTTIVAAQVVTADSLSPPSGNSTNTTLTSVYSNTTGYTNLGYVHLLINYALDGSHACYVAYQTSSNTMILLNDAGSGWLGPIPAGPAGTLQNSQCVLNGIGSSAAGSGNSLSFTASLSFKSSFAGGKTVFLYADGAGGVNSGWQSRGIWTVPTGLMRTADSVSPSSGNTANATLMALYSDTAGYANLGYVHLLISSVLSTSNACYVAYQRSSNTLILLNDAGNSWLGPIAAGSAGTLQNSQCVLNGSGSSATGSGNSLNFTASVSFKSSFAGSKTVFLYADGAEGVNSGWQSRGTWTVPTNLLLTTDSVSPSSGNTANATLTAVYSNTAGYTNLGYAHLLINSGLVASNACYVAYQLSSNTLILLNDAGNGWLGPITAGSAGSLQNSQCVLNGSGSSATGSGNSLNFTASLSFKASFAGGRTVFLYADGGGGINSGWQSRGTWTVPGSELLTADSVAPSSGTTVNATLTAVYSDTAGYANLGYVHLLINAGLSASNACYAAYQRSSNSLILLNDAGNGWLGPITAGSGVTLQNSQCVLNASGSSATGSGSNLTLTVALTFKPSFTGSKTVFLYVDGSGGLNSGWQSRGTWIVP